MNRIRKIIILLICIFITCLIIFLNKDFIIRQYFIAKIKDVDYDEYILTTLYNGKLKEKSYYTEDFGIVQNYDENEEKIPIVTVYDYTKKLEYQYNMLNYDIRKSIETETWRPVTVNNENLLKFLKGNKNNCKFKYKGIENINNRDCYVLEFEDKQKKITDIYLNKKLLYTVKIDNYVENNFSEHNVYEYILDLELKEKDIFKGFIEE